MNDIKNEEDKDEYFEDFEYEETQSNRYWEEEYNKWWEREGQYEK